MNRLARLLPALVVLLLVSLRAPSAHADPGDNYTISLVTMSPGEPVFFRFGHNAIWVHDDRTGRDEVFNWGTFSFEEPGLITKFLRGRLTYWLSVQSMSATLRAYQYEQRSIVSQELNLTGAQKLQMVQAMRDNARPENRKYQYHYYRDNCSTRVRDAIDAGTGGALRAVSQDPSPLTYRGETRRLVADVMWAYIALNLAMGSFIDQPVTLWEDMFVPERVMQQARKATTRNAAGEVVPLVKSEKVMLPLVMEPPPDSPPNRILPFLVVSSLLSALLGWIGTRAVIDPKGRKSALGWRLGFGLPLIVIGLLAGFLGSMFLFFWTATDHEVAWHNENLLQTSPLALALVVLGVGLIGARGWARKWFVHVVWALLGMSVLGLLLNAMPWWFKQVNGEGIALWLPLWVALGGVGWLARRASRSTPATP
ncbi:MAG TPA: DUF4105 domain-containing protein [Polyangiaceae bacterium]|nr:DUF4105 domain-containing protein [Polyangiaceae bacterium]